MAAKQKMGSYGASVIFHFLFLKVFTCTTAFSYFLTAILCFQSSVRVLISKRVYICVFVSNIWDLGSSHAIILILST